jgi:hypothetical protein
MELIRLGIVYSHLIACCIAIGLVLTNDVAMIKRLFRRDADTRQDGKHLAELKSTVFLALSALWVTGIALVWVDASTQGLAYFFNPKLQAKIGIVMLLTLNGFLLHYAVMPALEKAGSLLMLPLNKRLLAMFAGTVSGVSWMYAAMLGVGRPLSWTYSLLELLGAYPLMIAFGFGTMALLTRIAGNRRSPQWGLPAQVAPNH